MPRMLFGPKTGAQKLTTAELKVQALELRKAAYSLSEIGQAVGRDKATVSRLLSGAVQPTAKMKVIITRALQDRLRELNLDSVLLWD